MARGIRWLAAVPVAFVLLAIAVVAVVVAKEVLEELEERRREQEFVPVLLPRGNASVSGVVRLDGEARPRAALDIRDCEHCVAAWDGAEPLDEAAMANADGTLPNAVVWAANGPHAGHQYPPDYSEKPRMVITHGRFVPHVLAVSGQEYLRIRNDDPCTHVVTTDSATQSHGKAHLPLRSETFLYFDAPEVGVRVQDPDHPWMEARIVAVGHPFHSVTGADGKFSVTGLPPGAYEFRVWHEVYAPEPISFPMTVGHAQALSHTVVLTGR